MQYAVLVLWKCGIWGLHRPGVIHNRGHV